MSKQHLTDEGVLNPCTADKRACKYAHVSSDGSFSEGTSVKDMETITKRLAEQAVKVGTPEAMEQYFHAKTSLEGAKAGTVTVTKSFISEVTRGKPLVYSLDPQNPDPEIMDLIRERVRNAGTEGKEKPASATFDIALLGKHPELADFQVELVQCIQNEATLSAAQDRLEPHNGFRAEALPATPQMIAAFFYHPHATENTREDLLTNAKMTKEQRFKLADETRTVWLTLMNTFTLKGEYRQNAVERTHAQLSAAAEDSIPAWKLRGYLKNRDKSQGLEHVLRVIDPKTLPDTTIFHYDTALTLVSEGVADSGLSRASQRKVVRLYRMDDGQQRSPQSFINHAGAWGALVNPEPKDAPESVKLETAAAFGKARATYDAVQADPAATSSQKRTAARDADKAEIQFRKAHLSKVKEDLDVAQANASKVFIRNKSDWVKEAKKLEKEYARLANESRWDVFEASFMD